MTYQDCILLMLLYDTCFLKLKKCDSCQFCTRLKNQEEHTSLCIAYSKASARYTGAGNVPNKNRTEGVGEGGVQRGHVPPPTHTFKSGGGAQMGFSPPPHLLDRPSVLILLFFHIL